LKDGKADNVGPGSSTRSILIALLSSLAFLLVVINLPAPRPNGTPATALPGLPAAEAATGTR
jgi:hypothetical protein